MLTRTRVILKPKVNGMFYIQPLHLFRQFSNKTEKNSTKANKGLSFLKIDTNSIRGKVIYGIGGVSLFYMFTKGFYHVTYDLLVSSPAC